MHKTEKQASFYFRNGLWLVLTLFFVSFLNFTLAQYVPVNPEDGFSAYTLEERAVYYQSQETKEKPSFLKRYVSFMGRYLHGDFGWSQTHDEPVLSVLKKPFLLSLSLSLVTLLLSYLGGYLFAGFYFMSSQRRKEFLYAGMAVFQALPKLLVAMVLILLFASDVGVNWFPFYGFEENSAQKTSAWSEVVHFFYSLTLPILTLMMAYVPKVFLYFVGLMQKDKEAWNFLRSRGLSEGQIYFGFQGPKLLKTLVWRFANDLVFLLFSYGFIVEIAFSLPGMGYLGYQAITSGDHDLYIGIFFLFALINLALNGLMQLVTFLVRGR